MNDSLQPGDPDNSAMTQDQRDSLAWTLWSGNLFDAFWAHQMGEVERILDDVPDHSATPLLAAMSTCGAYARIRCSDALGVESETAPVFVISLRDDIEVPRAVRLAVTIMNAGTLFDHDSFRAAVAVALGALPPEPSAVETPLPGEVFFNDMVREIISAAQVIVEEAHRFLHEHGVDPHV
ncbi:hypothetical protein D3C74_270300 [compost metagenome]